MTIYAPSPLKLRKVWDEYLVHEHHPVSTERIAGVDVFGQSACFHYDIPDGLVEKALALGGRVSGCTLGDEEDHDE